MHPFGAYILNKVQYRRIASVSVSVSVSAETENVVSATVLVTAVNRKSDFGRSLIPTATGMQIRTSTVGAAAVHHLVKSEQI